MLADNSVIWSLAVTVWVVGITAATAYFPKLGNNLKVFTSCVDAECSPTIGQTLAMYGLFGTCKV